MPKLNPRHVHSVDVTDGAKEGTCDMTVKGFNDQQKCYEITLRGIGGPECLVQETRVLKHIHTLHAWGPTAHISYKYPVLLLICNFVDSFFGPHYAEE